MTHLATVLTISQFRLPYLACSCGYCGPVRDTADEAHADLAAHLRAVDRQAA